MGTLLQVCFSKDMYAGAIKTARAQYAKIFDRQQKRNLRKMSKEERNQYLEAIQYLVRLESKCSVQDISVYKKLQTPRSQFRTVYREILNEIQPRMCNQIHLYDEEEKVHLNSIFSQISILAVKMGELWGLDWQGMHSAVSTYTEKLKALREKVENTGEKKREPYLDQIGNQMGRYLNYLNQYEMLRAFQFIEDFLSEQEKEGKQIPAPYAQFVADPCCGCGNRAGEGEICICDKRWIVRNKNLLDEATAILSCVRNDKTRRVSLQRIFFDEYLREEGGKYSLKITKTYPDMKTEPVEASADEMTGFAIGFTIEEVKKALVGYIKEHRDMMTRLVFCGEGNADKMTADDQYKMILSAIPRVVEYLKFERSQFGRNEFLTPLLLAAIIQTTLLFSPKAGYAPRKKGMITNKEKRENFSFTSCFVNSENKDPFFLHVICYFKDYLHILRLYGVEFAREYLNLMRATIKIFLDAEPPANKGEEFAELIYMAMVETLVPVSLINEPIQEEREPEPEEFMITHLLSQLGEARENSRWLLKAPKENENHLLMLEKILRVLPSCYLIPAILNQVPRDGHAEFPVKIRSEEIVGDFIHQTIFEITVYHKTGFCLVDGSIKKEDFYLLEISLE